MRAVAEYRQRARECQLASSISLEDKYALDRVAQTWETLAKRRERDIGVED
jgi:hypothetical protein